LAHHSGDRVRHQNEVRKTPPKCQGHAPPQPRATALGSNEKTSHAGKQSPERTPLDTAHGPTENGRGVEERPFGALGKWMDAGRRINPGLVPWAEEVCAVGTSFRRQDWLPLPRGASWQRLRFPSGERVGVSGSHLAQTGPGLPLTRPLPGMSRGGCRLHLPGRGVPC
jgi:hypothetical protein